jgi:hypothetical protein
VRSASLFPKCLDNDVSLPRLDQQRVIDDVRTPARTASSANPAAAAQFDTNGSGNFDSDEEVAAALAAGAATAVNPGQCQEMPTP